ncbi:MAG: endonuclease NucS [Gammaproteobacteria bacterium]|nr:endonuclease NucS [Gammaproteobacteria bacterium]MCY4274769.1 endonuclease NucS [Gammaproteobacteria bacterium]
MTKLAMWHVEQLSNDNELESKKLKPVKHSHIPLERHLEDWIVKDVSLIGKNLTIVGQQVSIDDGRLDLLAIDSHDRWVVIEVKVGQLWSQALCQAFYYAASLARLDAEEIRDKLICRINSLGGDKKVISSKIESMLTNEGEHREIVVMLVGVGIHAGLKRLKEYLERFQIPVSIVSFEVFEPDVDTKLLVREVIEEETKPDQQKSKRTVERIRQMAKDAGVGDQFDRFEKMSEEAGLSVQPQAMSIRIAPKVDRRRYLMYASPFTDEGTGGLVICATGSEFIKYFGIDEEKAKNLDINGRFTGKEIDKPLNEIKTFLEKIAENIRRSDLDATSTEP